MQELELKKISGKLIEIDNKLDKDTFHISGGEGNVGQINGDIINVQIESLNIVKPSNNYNYDISPRCISINIKKLIHNTNQESLDKIYKIVRNNKSEDILQKLYEMPKILTDKDEIMFFLHFIKSLKERHQDRCYNLLQYEISMLYLKKKYDVFNEELVIISSNERIETFSLLFSDIKVTKMCNKNDLNHFYYTFLLLLCH